MTEISGNTYSVRNQLKALGGKPVKRAGVWIWLVPDHAAEQARALVKPSKGAGRAPRTCKARQSRINYGVYCGKCEYR